MGQVRLKRAKIALVNDAPTMQTHNPIRVGVVEGLIEPAHAPVSVGEVERANIGGLVAAIEQRRLAQSAPHVDSRHKLAHVRQRPAERREIEESVAPRR